MASKGSLVLPIIDADDRVNTGRAEVIDVRRMYDESQYMPLSGQFKPLEFVKHFTVKERKTQEMLSKEEKNDGVSSKKIFTMRAHNPIDPVSSTHENVRRRGTCESAMSNQYKFFTLCVEIGRRLILRSRQPIPVDADKAMAQDNEAMDDEESDENQTIIPLPMRDNCSEHEGGCYCVEDSDIERVSSMFSTIVVDDLNRCTSIEDQREMLNQWQVPFLDSVPAIGKDEPIILLEMIPREQADPTLAIDNTDIPLAFRFVFIIPEAADYDFGEVVHSMIEEYGSKKRGFRKLTHYQQHREIRSKEAFLEIVGTCMWGKKDQYTNPRINRACPDILKGRNQFVSGVEKILSFQGDLEDVSSSKSAVDKRDKRWQDVLHKDTAKRCFRVSSYFRNGVFCPLMECQRNTLLLDYELLKLENEQHVLLKKYNLWHYLEHKEYYDRRSKSQKGAQVARPVNSTQGSSSEILRNPQSMNSELSSTLSSDLMANLSELDRNRLQMSIKQWEDGQEGAGLNTFRYRQKMDLQVYEEEGRHLTTNEERREHYSKWIEDSVKSFKRYSSRQDLFLSTRGLLDFAKKKQGSWNPLTLGFRSIPAPNMGVFDLFIAELFHVSETLFYVSTHTGILLFCYICTADAFCTRLNKNNWIFKGSPDTGKSYTSNKVKDAMLIPETILVKTKQSDAALDDIDVMDYRNMMEEANMNLWYKNSKYTKLQDEEKNRITANKCVAQKKVQYKDNNDIVRWHTRQIITIHSMQIGCSTNETQLERKCIPAMISRVPPKDMPKVRREKGRRAVSDMNSAQQQQSDIKKRRTDQFSNKYQYDDSLRGLIYKNINLGILTQPTRTAYDMVVDKCKAFMKNYGISFDSRTEDRMYGKAVSIMILRIITTLFEFPKPNSEQMIVAAPFSADVDPWKLSDDDFPFTMHPDDFKRILKESNKKDNFDNVRFVDSSGTVVQKLFVQVNYQKALNEDDEPVYFLRTVQKSKNRRSGQRTPSFLKHCPESLVGEFYRQWVSIHHSNCEHFVKCVSPLMTISLEDTVQAIWQSRSETSPDKLPLFKKLLERLAINCLKKDVLREPSSNRKRRKMFKSMRVEVSEDNEYAVDYTYLLLGKLKEVVATLASDNAGKSEESNSYPEGFEVYFDKKTIRDMLEDFRSVKDTQGYLYKSPSRINDDNEPFFGVVQNADGTLPNWDLVGPRGEVYEPNQYNRRKDAFHHKNFKPKQSFLSGTEDDKKECAKAGYAKRQRDENMASTRHRMPVIEIVESGQGGIKDSSLVYLNLNWIEQNFATRNEKLEDMNPLILFFQTLGYRYDGIKITEAQRVKFAAECRERFRKNCERDVGGKNRDMLEKILKADLERLQKQTIPEGAPDSDAGHKILLGSPFLGYTINEDGERDKRTCTPQLSMSVTIHHSEAMWFTEKANVPSKNAAEILNLPTSESEKERVDLTFPINDFATMTRMDFLCILEDGFSRKDYKALYELQVPLNGRAYFPYRFASPNHIRKQIHDVYKQNFKPDGNKKLYPYTSHYPHDAAYHEEKSYDCKRVQVNGKWRWVKYEFLKQKNHSNSELSADQMQKLQSRFGSPVSVPMIEEEIGEREANRHLDELIQDRMQDATLEDNVEEEWEPEEQASSKRLRLS
jgi:hypothetical protein